MAFVYILRCSDNSYYVGSTRDLERRLWEHGTGVGARFTRSRRPVTLVFAEEYPRIDEAFAREKQVQGWSRRKREALIKQNAHRLPELSRKSFGQRGR